MNDGRKRSLFLTPKQAAMLCDATYRAFCMNRPLNRDVTIHLETAGVKATAHQTLTAFLKHAGDWLRLRTGLSPAYIWVLENGFGDDGTSVGLHVHICMHVPDAHWPDFRKMTRRWLRLSGGILNKKVVEAQTLLSWEHGDVDDFLKNGLIGWTEYLLKGLHPDDAASFGVAEPEPQGEVRGKRCGRSESLDPTKFTWTTYVFPQWPGIWVTGPELRTLRFLRRVIPDALPGELNDAQCVTVERRQTDQQQRSAPRNYQPRHRKTAVQPVRRPPAAETGLRATRARRKPPKGA
jgi:hypothetical protein